MPEQLERAQAGPEPERAQRITIAAISRSHLAGCNAVLDTSHLLITDPDLLSVLARDDTPKSRDGSALFAWSLGCRGFQEAEDPARRDPHHDARSLFPHRWRRYHDPAVNTIRILPRAVLLGVFVLLLASSPWGLWDRDEGRYADVAQRMLDSGDFITPRMNGFVFLDKPPLVYWVTAGSLALWGHNETGARFGQFLFAAGTLFFVHRIGRLLFDERRAMLAVLVLASATGFFVSSHILTLDLGLTFFLTLTLLAFLKGWREAPRGARWYLLMFAAAALGVLSKGLVGVLLPAMTIACFLTLRGRWDSCLKVPWLGGVLLSLAIAAPWFVLVSIRHPEFPAYFFLHEHLARFASGVHHRSGQWYYYLAVLSLGMLPWSLILPARLARTHRPLRGVFSLPRSEASAFIFSWIVPGLLFFTVARSKLPLYILPVFPGVALATAAALDHDPREEAPAGKYLWRPGIFLIVLAIGTAAIWGIRQDWLLKVRAEVAWPVLAMVGALAAAAFLSWFLLVRRERILPGAGIAALLWMAACYGALAVAGRMNFYNESRHFAEVLREERTPAERVYGYRCYLRGLPFYLRGTMDLVAFHSDDIEVGSHEKEGGGVLSEAELVSRLEGDARAFVVARRRDLPSLQRKTGMPLYVLAESNAHYLVSNLLDPRRRRELGEILGSGRIDLAWIEARAASLLPGARIEMIEVERQGTELRLALQMYREEKHYEVRFPLPGPGEPTLQEENGVSEEDGGEVHILRVALGRGSLHALPESVFSPSD